MTYPTVIGSIHDLPHCDREYFDFSCCDERTLMIIPTVTGSIYDLLHSEGAPVNFSRCDREHS